MLAQVSILYIYISYIHYINGLVEGKCARKPWFAPNIWGLPADFPLNQLKSIECIYIYHYISYIGDIQK
jgi:hypothetical protein